MAAAGGATFKADVRPCTTVHGTDSEDESLSYPARVIVREGPVAPWRQVFDLYRQRIESGELPPGSRLPSIRGMSQEFGIAGTTAQKVIGALKADGLVVTSPMGTFVAER